MEQVDKIKSKGRYGDTELVHMSKGEVNSLARLANSHGKKLTKNPKTGLKEAFNLMDELKNVVSPLYEPTKDVMQRTLYDPLKEKIIDPLKESVIDPLTGKTAAKAAEEAAALAQTATDRATAENARQFDITQANLAPWLQAGTTALGSQQSLMGLGGQTPADVQKQLELDPGYQFRLAQGQKSLNSGLAARGGMGSGAAMKAGIDYNQGAASQEYGNVLNRLASLSGTGQTTGQNLGTLGSNYAANQGNLWTQNANMQGASGIAGANARQSGLSNIFNLAGSAYAM